MSGVSDYKVVHVISLKFSSNFFQNLFILFVVQKVSFFSYRKVDHSQSLEKAITVYGQPENCTAACRRILEVMEEEARNTGKPTEICLKILAHNNLIGRIIGKQGGTIKKIMEVGIIH